MKLLIVGCGGHGCNCLEIARGITCGDSPLYDCFAFIDDAHTGELICDCEVIGSLSEIDSFVNDYDEAFVAIGNNEIRYKMTQMLIDAGYRMATLISSMSNISSYSQIGSGSVVFPFASVEPNAFVGEGAVIDTGVVVGHDSIIDDFALVYANSVIRPNSKIDKLSTISANTVIDNRGNVNV